MKALKPAAFVMLAALLLVIVAFLLFVLPVSTGGGTF